MAGQPSQAGDAAVPGSFYELLERVEQGSAKPETTSGTNLKRRLRPAPPADAEPGRPVHASPASLATAVRPPERKPAAPSAAPADDDSRADARPTREAGRAIAGTRETTDRAVGASEPRSARPGPQSGNEAAEPASSEEAGAGEPAANQSGEIDAAPQASDPAVALPEICSAESETKAAKPEPDPAPGEGEAPPGQAPPSILLTPDPAAAAAAPPPQAALAAAMAAPTQAAPMQPDATAPATAPAETLRYRMQTAGRGPESIGPAGDGPPAAEALPFHAFGLEFDMPPPEDPRAGMSQREQDDAPAAPETAARDGLALAAPLSEPGIGLVAAGAPDNGDSARQSASGHALADADHAAPVERAAVEHSGREHSSPDHEESSRQDPGESRANASAAAAVEAPAPVAAHAMSLQHQASVAVPAPAGAAANQTPPAANTPAPAAEPPALAAALDTDAPVEDTRATGPIRIELPREPGAANGSRVGIEIQQQGERVRVDVRTQDTTLKGLLRGDLTELLESLSRQGLTARPAGEARHAATGPVEDATLWAPQPAGRPVADTAGSQPGQNQSGDSPDLSGRRQRQPEERNNRRGRQRTPGDRFELSEIS